MLEKPDWLPLQIWGGPEQGKSGILQHWNPDTGHFRVNRTTDRYGRDPDKYLAAYSKDGIRDIVSTAVGKTVTVGAHNPGVILYMDVPYTNVFASFSADFGLQHENEFVVYAPRVD